MNLILVLFAAVLPFAAHGSTTTGPDVGAYSAYDAIDVTRNGTKHWVIEFEMLNFNPQKREYLVRYTVSKGPIIEERIENWVHESGYFEKSNVRRAMQDCSGLNGKRERITVGAGTFDTCAIKSETDGHISTTWFGDVPFGYVKFELITKATGELATSTLRSTHR
jgi:hypothetical protein